MTRAHANTPNARIIKERPQVFPGSARVSRAGFGVSPKPSFPDDLIPRKVRESETLSPTRGTHALPRALARATWL